MALNSMFSGNLYFEGKKRGHVFPKKNGSVLLTDSRFEIINAPQYLTIERAISLFFYVFEKNFQFIINSHSKAYDIRADNLFKYINIFSTTFTHLWIDKSCFRRSNFLFTF